VPVDFSSVQVVADDAMLLQLKCDGCGSYIVLHASVAGSGKDIAEVEEVATANISSKLNIATDEVKMVTEALKESDGSFGKLFEKYNVGKDNNESTSE